jgi:hypothetical protein
MNPTTGNHFTDSALDLFDFDQVADADSTPISDRLLESAKEKVEEAAANGEVD